MTYSGVFNRFVKHREWALALSQVKECFILVAWDKPSATKTPLALKEQPIRRGQYRTRDVPQSVRCLYWRICVQVLVVVA
jgi:hypothetical protein